MIELTSKTIAATKAPLKFLKENNIQLILPKILRTVRTINIHAAISIGIQQQQIARSSFPPVNALNFASALAAASPTAFGASGGLFGSGIAFPAFSASSVAFYLASSAIIMFLYKH